jgi:hypothetical protein
MPIDAAFSALPSPPRRRRLLSDRKVLILRRAAEAIFASRNQAVPQERLDWLEIEINDYLAATSGMTRSVVWFFLNLIQIAPPFTGVRIARFTSCTIEQRQRCMHRLESSPFFFSTVVAVLTKALLCTIYFEHPDALLETGYDGKCKKSSVSDVLSTRADS